MLSWRRGNPINISDNFNIFRVRVVSRFGVEQDNGISIQGQKYLNYFASLWPDNYTWPISFTYFFFLLKDYKKIKFVSNWEAQCS